MRALPSEFETIQNKLEAKISDFRVRLINAQFSGERNLASEGPRENCMTANLMFFISFQPTFSQNLPNPVKLPLSINEKPVLNLRKEPRLGRPKTASMAAVRVVRPDDTPRLLEIAQSTGLFGPGEVEELLANTLTAFHEGTLGENHCARAVDDPKSAIAVGWTYFAPQENDEGITWEIFWIGVAPSLHRTGYGSLLLADAEEEARKGGAQRMKICTSSLPGTSAARAFYIRHGYSQSGYVPDFYGPGDDKIEFVKGL